MCHLNHLPFCGESYLIAVLSHKNDIIEWPSVDEMLCISNEIMQQYGLSNCIGIMDGTLLELQYASLLHPENCHSRKVFCGAGINSL
jgi:hypothetical protein